MMRSDGFLRNGIKQNVQKDRERNILSKQVPLAEAIEGEKEYLYLINLAEKFNKKNALLVKGCSSDEVVAGLKCYYTREELKKILNGNNDQAVSLSSLLNRLEDLAKEYRINEDALEAAKSAVEGAFLNALIIHAPQERAYENRKYIWHPLEQAYEVIEFFSRNDHNSLRKIRREQLFSYAVVLVVEALLHDSCEDYTKNYMNASNEDWKKIMFEPSSFSVEMVRDVLDKLFSGFSDDWKKYKMSSYALFLICIVSTPKNGKRCWEKGYFEELKSNGNGNASKNSYLEQLFGKIKGSGQGSLKELLDLCKISEKKDLRAALTLRYYALLVKLLDIKSNLECLVYDLFIMKCIKDAGSDEKAQEKMIRQKVQKHITNLFSSASYVGSPPLIAFLTTPDEQANKIVEYFKRNKERLLAEAEEERIETIKEIVKSRYLKYLYYIKFGLKAVGDTFVDMSQILMILSYDDNALFAPHVEDVLYPVHTMATSFRFSRNKVREAPRHVFDVDILPISFTVWNSGHKRFEVEMPIHFTKLLKERISDNSEREEYILSQFPDMTESEFKRSVSEILRKNLEIDQKAQEISKMVFSPAKEDANRLIEKIKRLIREDDETIVAKLLPIANTYENFIRLGVLYELYIYEVLSKLSRLDGVMSSIDDIISYYDSIKVRKVESINPFGMSHLPGIWSVSVDTVQMSQVSSKIFAGTHMLPSILYRNAGIGGVIYLISGSYGNVYRKNESVSLAFEHYYREWKENNDLIKQKIIRSKFLVGDSGATGI